MHTILTENRHRLFGIMLLFLSMILSDLASPAEAGFAKAGNRPHPRIKSKGRLFGIMLSIQRMPWSLWYCGLGGGAAAGG